MEKLIGACGLCCSECEGYKATQANDAEAIAQVAAQWTEQFGSEINPESIWCDGCLANSNRKCGHCSECDVRTCVVRHNIANCAHCDEYGCDTITGFMQSAPCVKEKLESIREGLGK